MASGSGAKVADQVTNIYNSMRITKTDDDPKEHPRIVIFKQKDGVIDVEPGKIFREKDLEGVEDVFKFLVDMLSEKECCYILYDCHYKTKETTKAELIFILWAPDASIVQNKILYSSSKQYIMKTVKGVKHNFEFQCLADIKDRCCFAEKIGKTIVTLEGQDLK